MKKILIADDDRTIHISFTKFLTEQGFEVLHAYDGKEAMELAQEQRPDIILLDLTMPMLDGRTVCKKLKEDAETEHIKIIMLTAKDAQHDITLGYELGADSYITKPCSIHFLERSLNKLIR